MISNFLKDKNVAVYNGSKFKLRNYKTDYKAGLDKKAGLEAFESLKSQLAEWQDKLYAQDQFSVLLVFQAIDAAGKDGTIKSVMTGVNPQGCQVVSFKTPTSHELDHDYLWRCIKELPERGRIGIFNRSYYEEVLVTKVHPEYILNQRLPDVQSLSHITPKFWESRYESIRNFEKHLADNGTIILKFFLNVSKQVQKERFLDRIKEPEKNWKFSYHDLEERKHWDVYQKAYEDAIRNTAAEHAPWFIIPSDSNWARNYMVCSILLETLVSMKLKYPKITKEEKDLLAKGKAELEAE
jgi:PPK2 family polyphosphate:nucleotide phosphotransferase